MSDYLDEFWTRHCTSTERGGRADHLHGQSVGSAHMRSDKKSIERCKKEMKQAMGASYGTASGVKIDLKVMHPAMGEGGMPGEAASPVPTVGRIPHTVNFD